MPALFWIMLACDTETTAAPPDQPDQAQSEATVIDRDAWPEQISARHILIAHKDSEKSNNSMSVSEAKALSDRLYQELQEDPSRFRALALEHSTGPSSKLGGHLGVFAQGAMVDGFEDVAFEMDINEISPPVETKFGFHIIQRLMTDEICISHIIFEWKADEDPQPRSQEETLALVGAAQERIAAGESFTDVARSASEGPYASRGGDLGCFTTGQMLPVFEEVSSNLQPGESSEVVESQHGFHIIHRNARAAEAPEG
jgi:peptidyl-prolyl cis-trans isomerase SurA